MSSHSSCEICSAYLQHVLVSAPQPLQLLVHLIQVVVDSLRAGEEVSADDIPGGEGGIERGREGGTEWGKEGEGGME